MQTRKPVLAGLAVALLLSACAVLNAQTRDNLFQVNGTPRLEAGVEISRLMVRAGTSGEIRIQTTLRHATQTSYQVIQNENTISINVRMATGFSAKGGQPVVEIIATVPPETDLALTSSTGDIYVDEVSGQISLSTSSGGIQLSDCQGTIALQNQTGSTDCRRVQGQVRIRSEAGSVTLQSVAGAFDAETTTGKINFSGELWGDQQHRFASNSGPIELEIVGSPDLRIKASSESGSVRCGLSIEQSASTKNECSGVLGLGSGSLQIRTSTGSITVR